MIKQMMKSIVPNPIIQARRDLRSRSINIRYEKYLQGQGSAKHRLLILATIEKSGTNFMRYLVANYLKIADGTSTGPVTPVEMHQMFPNYWYTAYIDPRDYQKPTPLLAGLGMDDFTHIHAAYWKYVWDSSKVLHLYRNPLDYAVSCYFYYYVHGTPTWRGTVSGPVEVLDKRLEQFATLYASYRFRDSGEDKDILRMAYEDLVREPQQCLLKVLKWMGVEPDPGFAEAAVANSTRDSITQMERDLPEDLTDDLTIVRDGSIGQWKQYFSIADVGRVRDRLDGFGIDLDDFELDG